MPSFAVAGAALLSAHMHELALCEAIAAKVTERAAGRTVARVTVQIGHLRQVVPDALSFAWQLVREQTPTLADSTLEIDHVPATISCPTCEAVATLTDAVLLCPGCGSADVVIETGEEFVLVSFEMPNRTDPDA